MTLRDDILSDDITEPQQIAVEQIVGNYVSQMAKVDTSQFIPFDGRSRQPRPAVDIDALPALIEEALEHKQEADGIPSNLWVHLKEDFPPGDITTEVITYGLIGREPASTSAGRHQNQERQEWKPHVRGVFDDETRAGYKIIVLGQKFESTMLFTCWAKTNKQANKRARWLEDTLRDYAWFIKYNGIDEFYFLGQGTDIELPLQGTKHTLKGRPMSYLVRTERISTVLESTIRHLVIKIGLEDSTEST